MIKADINDRKTWITGSKVRGFNPFSILSGTTLKNEGYLRDIAHDRIAGGIPCVEIAHTRDGAGWIVAAIAGLEILEEPAPPTLRPEEVKPYTNVRGRTRGIGRVVEGYVTAAHVTPSWHDAHFAGKAPSVVVTQVSNEEARRLGALGNHHGNYVELAGLEILELPKEPEILLPKRGDRIRVTAAPLMLRERIDFPIVVLRAERAVFGYKETATVLIHYTRLATNVQDSLYVTAWEPLPACAVPAKGDYVKVVAVRPGENPSDAPAYAVGETFEVTRGEPSVRGGGWAFATGERGSVIGEFAKAERPAPYVPKPGELVRVAEIRKERQFMLDNWPGLRVGSQFRVFHAFPPDHADAHCCIARDSFSGGVFMHVEPVKP